LDWKGTSQRLANEVQGKKGNMVKPKRLSPPKPPFWGAKLAEGEEEAGRRGCSEVQTF